MYTQIALLCVSLVSGLCANFLTLKARTTELDNESIGSQERYYRTWCVPVYLWCLHYISLMGFIATVMFTLYKTGSSSGDQSVEQTT